MTTNKASTRPPHAHTSLADAEIPLSDTKRYQILAISELSGRNVDEFNFVMTSRVPLGARDVNSGAATAAHKARKSIMGPPLLSGAGRAALDGPRSDEAVRAMALAARLAGGGAGADAAGPASAPPGAGGMSPVPIVRARVRRLRRCAAPPSALTAHAERRSALRGRRGRAESVAPRSRHRRPARTRRR